MGAAASSSSSGQRSEASTERDEKLFLQGWGRNIHSEANWEKIYI
jgi:hypothetical protein